MKQIPRPPSRIPYYFGDYHSGEIEGASHKIRGLMMLPHTGKKGMPEPLAVQGELGP